ncbi:SDR family oxidoreductase [Desulfospira joergensenii]|uniref:SDR family oxidoreductase n=1 Tax=Desulfospira joergensenii TaxID=53329 RepID=UPI0003B67EBF|nr:SDR family oxidoreductase [Desulfospira joergensenii]
MKHYFVTGATGAIGAALIPLLLEDQDSSIDLLIRAENENHLQERLNKLFVFWEFDFEDERKKRVNGIIGDISQALFGMNSIEYDRLSKKCTHIIHSAGNVRMNLPLEEARRCSVDSAKNVVELAGICLKNKNLEKIEFVSTVGVGGRMPGIVPETWIDTEREFHNTYEQAKAEAEDFIRKQVEKGMPITVHRPSMVVGDSITGKIIHYQIFYHLCEFLSGRRTLGFTPATGTARLDIIPSDYVAKVIAWSSKTQETSGLILHECSGPDNAILISDLRKKIRKIIKAYRYRLAPCFLIPVWLFKTVLPAISLFVSADTKRAMKALPVFFDYLSTTQCFDNKLTIEITKKVFRFSNTDQFLERVLVHYFDKVDSE